jgi:protein TonB
VRVLAIAICALVLTVAFFLVLPLIQAIGKPPKPDRMLTAVDTAHVPPPPQILEEEPEEEPEPEEKPPELSEDAPPLDLSQLELALNPGFSDSWLAGDFAVKLDAVAGADDVDALFSLSDLDQEPRAVYQPSPLVDARVRKRAPGTVHVLFIVDQQGRVQNPTVWKSSDPAFEKPALAAVKQWKFEPGKRNGKAVRFRMRVPVTFPE